MSDGRGFVPSFGSSTVFSLFIKSITSLCSAGREVERW